MTRKTKIGINWFGIIFGTIFFILTCLAISGGVDLMTNGTATQTAFYGILLLVIAREMASALRVIANSIRGDKKQ